MTTQRSTGNPFSPAASDVENLDEIETVVYRDTARVPRDLTPRYFTIHRPPQTGSKHGHHFWDQDRWI